VTEAAHAAPALARNTTAAAERSLCIFIITPLFSALFELGDLSEIRSDDVDLFMLWGGAAGDFFLTNCLAAAAALSR